MVAEKRKTIADVLKWATGLLDKYGIPNPSLDAQIILGHVLRLKRLELYLNLREKIDSREQEKYQELITKRTTRIPLAYLTGQEEFMGFSFLVNEHVLIPRPETEILVETVLNKIEKPRKYIIVDLGIGCGNIAVCLAKFINQAEIYAVDISPKALKTARLNARKHSVIEKLNFIQGDLFNPWPELKIKGKVDFIVSNPPYIKRDSLENLQPEVRFEPRLALDGGQDGLAFYHRIILEAGAYLKENGYLVLEIPDGESGVIKGIIDKAETGFLTEIIKDFAGIDRVMVAQKRSNK